MQGADFAEYFPAVYVINLPERTDRLASVREELGRLGLNDDRVQVPDAPIAGDANGFPSRGVYGNFLSHLSILKDISNRGLERALILEDDAIFRTGLRAPEFQRRIVAEAEAQNWAMWFIGHRLRQGLRGEKRGVVRTERPFTWAHCYAVRAPVLDDLIGYLSAVIDRPAGDPLGGKMYIDGAFGMFRRQFTDHACVVCNPAMSIQKGSHSNLAQPDGHRVSAVLETARRARDEFWRRTGIDFRSGH